jgi:hypothetical protein
MEGRESWRTVVKLLATCPSLAPTRGSRRLTMSRACHAAGSLSVRLLRALRYFKESRPLRGATVLSIRLATGLQHGFSGAKE